MKDIRGFSLVEVTLAIGVFAFVIVAVIALYSLALDYMGKSQHELQSANLMTRVVDDYRRLFLNQEPSSFGLPDPVGLPVASSTSGQVFLDGLGGVTSSADALYRLRFRVERLEGEDARLRLHLLFAWPANATHPQVIQESITVLARHLQ